jgi:hypothetical protein
MLSVTQMLWTPAGAGACLLAAGIVIGMVRMRRDGTSVSAIDADVTAPPADSSDHDADGLGRYRYGL